MTSPAALYARVSTEQQQENATIASQIAEIESFAQREGYSIAADHDFI